MALYHLFLLTLCVTLFPLFADAKMQQVARFRRDAPAAPTFDLHANSHPNADVYDVGHGPDAYDLTGKGNAGHGPDANDHEDLIDATDDHHDDTNAVHEHDDVDAEDFKTLDKSDADVDGICGSGGGEKASEGDWFIFRSSSEPRAACFRVVDHYPSGFDNGPEMCIHNAAGANFSSVHSPDEFHFITRHWDLHHFWVGE
jgi:hypothetical protein